jgi:glycosyltransferase involved in cell wall biosynthesis
MQILFLTILFTGLLFVIYSVLGSIIYDLSLAKINKQAIAHPYSRALRKRPKVSIIVFAENNAEQLIKCLQSIGKNNYRKYEISVVSTDSSDEIKSAVADFSKKYKSKKIRVINSYSKEALTDNSEIILELNDSFMLDKNALFETIKFFALNKDASVLIPQVSGVFKYTVSSLLLQYEYILKNNFKKSKSALYRMDNNNGGIKAYKLFPEQPAKIQFCANIKSYTNKPASLQNQQKSMLRLGLYIAGFVIVSYLMYLALAAHYTALLALVWLGFSFFVALNIWAEEDLKLPTKISMIFLAPMISLLMYLKLPVKLLKLASFQPVRQHPSVDFVG